MKDLIYIGYYDVLENNAENRNTILAATNKMSYIIDVFSRCAESVLVVSASGSRNNHCYPGKTVKLKDNARLKLFPTLGSGCRVRRVLSRWLLNVDMFFFLLRHIKRGQTVIVYHSLGYLPMIKLLRRFKKFRLVLELEELYGDVMENAAVTEKELSFARTADAYIFPTVLLNEKINREQKPFALIHGTYRAEAQKMSKERYRSLHGWDNDKIHVVYAGTFDPRKGGGVAAALSAKHLSSRYHLHILGFGSTEEVKDMQDLIAELSKKCACTVTYDGLLSGDDYIHFLQACDIGLSTQNPAAAFNASSFPSKILSYMANGLRVVSIRIPAVEGSAVGGNVCYYDTQTPEAIAAAILATDTKTSSDSRTRIEQLDAEFEKEILRFAEEIHGTPL